MNTPDFLSKNTEDIDNEGGRPDEANVPDPILFVVECVDGKGIKWTKEECIHINCYHPKWGSSHEEGVEGAAIPMHKT